MSSLEDYDEEFGPNKVIRCEDCHVKLMVDEICWCTAGGRE
jgi:hypothetical protein